MKRFLRPPKCSSPTTSAMAAANPCPHLQLPPSPPSAATHSTGRFNGEGPLSKRFKSSSSSTTPSSPSSLSSFTQSVIKTSSSSTSSSSNISTAASNNLTDQDIIIDTPVCPIKKSSTFNNCLPTPSNPPLINLFRRNKEDKPLLFKGAVRHDPLSIVSWNANGLVRRINSDNWSDFKQYITKTDPDVVCLQEVRIPAHCETPTAKISDSAFRHRSVVKHCDAASIAEAKVVNQALELRPFDQYNLHWSLADWKYAGQLMMIKKDIEVGQTRYNLKLDRPRSEHNSEGRIILVEFGTFTLLSTYVCNTGWDMEKFKRRAEWDRDLREYVKLTNDRVRFYNNIKNNDLVPTPLPASSVRSEVEVESTDDVMIINSIAPAPPNKGEIPGLFGSPPPKPLIWVGDVNCAPTDDDLSHPEFFSKQKPTGKGAQVFFPKEYMGQPGCTIAERNGLQEIIKAGDLIDTFRHSNPLKGPPPLNGRHFTWRGTAGKERAEFGKYYGMGMRIDIPFVHSSLLPRVLKSEIVGERADRHNFFGSDHCPIFLALSPSTSFPRPGGSTQVPPGLTLRSNLGTVTDSLGQISSDNASGTINEISENMRKADSVIDVTDVATTKLSDDTTLLRDVSKPSACVLGKENGVSHTDVLDVVDNDRDDCVELKV